jgi:hypothetical protein
VGTGSTYTAGAQKQVKNLSREMLPFEVLLDSQPKPGTYGIAALTICPSARSRAISSRSAMILRAR